MLTYQSPLQAVLALGLLGVSVGAISGCNGTSDYRGNTMTEVASCSLSENSTANGTVTNGCAMLTLDTTSCEASRIAQGLSGNWLKFSCRVGLLVSGSDVLVSIDDRPNYKSNYFSSTDACYVSYNPPFPDPNMIKPKSVIMTIPLNPVSSDTNTPMQLGAVGVAINGVLIYDNSAAPGDDIYNEAYSFDQCQGHPDGNDFYHYHSEPYAISHKDDHLIGVMRDGYFLYGRYDNGGSTDAVLSTDTINGHAYGGHVGPLPNDTSTTDFHYHVNAQTGTTSGPVGVHSETDYFLTNGLYYGTPGTCSGCP